MSAKKVRLDRLGNEKPQRRKGRLQQRLKELNARGEQELASLMENIEKIKAAFRSGRN